ncbi:MAG: cobalamin B12-binding domain-containing protein [Alphaproteobacteria bacterium]|nr:cobalamin B12-binding domain-containing protein [Alphaproteobacteria bacterium]
MIRKSVNYASPSVRPDNPVVRPESDGKPNGTQSRKSSTPNRERNLKPYARWESLISDQILPRLMLVHDQASRREDQSAPLSEDQIREFCTLSLSADGSAARLYFEALQAAGHSFETLCLHLLTPAARLLGADWVDDECDFMDVTLGVGRMQQLLSLCCPVAERPVIDIRHRILLATAPGEQHVFGIEMLGTMLRKAGWDVTIQHGPSIKRLAASVAEHWYGVVGLALSTESGLQDVGRSIEDMRRTSRNPDLAIMVGGPIFAGHPERAVQVGADSLADDALAAVNLAKKLLKRQSEAV